MLSWTTASEWNGRRDFRLWLENVRERLESMVEGEMKMESNGAGTVVTLRIPLVGGF